MPGKQQNHILAEVFRQVFFCQTAKVDAEKLEPYLAGEFMECLTAAVELLHQTQANCSSV